MDLRLASFLPLLMHCMYLLSANTTEQSFTSESSVIIIIIIIIIQLSTLSQDDEHVSCPYVDRLSLTGSMRLNAHISRLAN